MRKVNVSELVGKSKMNGYFRAVFVILLIIVIFDGFDATLFGVAMTSVIGETGISEAVFGVIGFVALIGMTLGAIVFGMLSDKIGRKPVLILSILTFCISTSAFSLANTAIMFGILRFLAGFGLAGALPAIMAMLSEYAPFEKRKNLTAVISMGNPIGTLVAPIVGIIIVYWRNLYAIGMIPLIMIIFIVLVLPESMEILLRRNQNDKITKILKKTTPDFVPEKDDVYEVVTKRGKEGTPFVNLFKDKMAKNTVCFWILYFMGMWASYSMTTWLPTLMVQKFHYGVDESKIVLIFFGLGAIPAILISGKIVNKFGYKKTMAVFFILNALTMLSLAIYVNLTVTAIEAFFVGAFLFGGFSLVIGFVTSNYPASIRGTGMGWASGIGRLGGAFGALIGGLLTGNLGVSYQLTFVIYAIPAVILFITVLFTTDRTKEFNS